MLARAGGSAVAKKKRCQEPSPGGPSKVIDGRSKLKQLSELKECEILTNEEYIKEKE